MLKRIFIDIGIILGVLVVGFCSIFGYFWIKDWPERSRERKEAEAFFAGLTAQRAALNSIGDVDLDTANLTLAILEEKLHEPRTKRSTQGTTSLGWICTDRDCAVMAAFLTPAGGEISKGASPFALMMAKPLVVGTHHLAIDGIRIGTTTEEIEKICRERNRVLRKSSKPIMNDHIDCGDSWSVRRGVKSGPNDVMVFINEKLVAQSHQKLE